VVNSTIQEKIAFFKEIAANNIFPAEVVDAEGILDLEKVLIGNNRGRIISEIQDERSNLSYFVLKDAGKVKGCIGFKKVKYEEGVEVPHNGQAQYDLSIKFLAFSDDYPPNLYSGLVARSLLILKNGNLFEVDIDTRDAEEIFRNLKFSQITGFEGWPKRFVLSLSTVKMRPKTIKPQFGLTDSQYLSKLPEEERKYHSSLKESTGFDILQFLRQLWTIYTTSSKERFAFTLTTKKESEEGVFKIDVYDLQKLLFVVYNDIIVPVNTNFALNEDFMADPHSVVPKTLEEYLGGIKLPLKEAEKLRRKEMYSVSNTRLLMPGLWVERSYRGRGFGRSLVRLAGDVCKLLYDKEKMGVMLDPPHLAAFKGTEGAFAFHTKIGAREVDDPLYRLEYLLNDAKRTLIKIV